ncbi:MAG: hypothetical protein R3D34_12935 [Nitratireductor sp.]
MVGEGKVIVSVGSWTSRAISRISKSASSVCISNRMPAILIHDQHPTMSFVDLNRTGVALMEIVSKPDLRSSEEARAYVTKLRTILRYLGTCDGNMEDRCALTSTSPCASQGEFGTRCEIKNVNSIRFIGQAIEYEACRQIAILEDGGSADQETRSFDPVKGETRLCAQGRCA